MLKSFKYTEAMPVALTIMMRQKVIHAFKLLTRPLVQRLLLLTLSALVAMSLGTGLLFAVQHPLTPALSIMHVGMPLALPVWKGGLI